MEVQLHNNIVNAKEVYECQLISDLVGRTSSSSSIYNYLKKLKKDESLPAVMYLESDSADINTAKAEVFNRLPLPQIPSEVPQPGEHKILLWYV